MIQYTDPIGIRQRSQYSTASGRAHVYDHWPYEILNGCLPSEYDEERRLFYVAVTRAKRHLVLTAGDSPSQFFTEFPLESESIEPDIKDRAPSVVESDSFSITPPTEDRPLRLSVHSMMDDSVYEDIEGGRGPAFGDQVHDFAEAYADGEMVEPHPGDEQTVKHFLDSLEGAFTTEITAILPFDGSPQLSLVGIVDLLVETDETVQIIDYKTDLSRQPESEYRKQLSVYYHVASEWYPNKEITASIFYTADDELVEIDPMERTTLKTHAHESM